MNFIDVIGKYLQSGRSWYNRNENTIKIITVHHDAIPHDNRSAEQIMSSIMKIHSDNGWAGMSYHIYIHRDGKVYLVNRFGWVTWHDGHNYDSLGILVTGYFHPPYNNKPTEAQLKSLREVLDWLCTKNPQFPASHANVYGHRERMSTACPGDTLTPYVVEYRNKLGRVGWGGSGGNSEDWSNEQCLIINNKAGSDKFGELVGKATKYDEFKNGGYENIDQVKNAINAYKGIESSLKKKISDLEIEISGLKTTVKNKNEELARAEEECQRQMVLKDGLINQANLNLEIANKANKELIGNLEAQERQTDDFARKYGDERIKVGKLEAEVKSLKSNIVPIGFINKLLWLFS